MSEVEFDSPLIVHLERTGRVITQIKSWSIDSDYTVSTDGFQFVAVDDDIANLRDLEGQPVKLVVAGVPQLFGRIDRTSRGADGKFAVLCSGRDYIADLVECNVDPTFTVREAETLGSAILKACAPIGITHIHTEGDADRVLEQRLGVRKKSKGSGSGSEPHSATLADLKPNIGQGLYDFLKPLCAHHHCTIQPSVGRDALLVAGPQYKQEAVYAIVRNTEQPAANNVLSATAERDYSSFPTITIVQGHGSPRTGEPTASAAQTIDTWSEAQHFGGELARTLDSITWTGRRKPGTTEALPIDKIYRLNVFRDDKARSHTEITAAAKRLFCEDLKKTLEYRVQLKGHIDPYSGAIWSVNTIVRVADEICDINEDLWIQSRKLSFSPSTGAITELVCIRPDTFDFQPGVAAPVPKKPPPSLLAEPTPRRGG